MLLASGELTPIGPPNRTPLSFTSIDYDPGENSVTITWNSRPNQLYSVFSSDDLGELEEITDNAEPQGELTSFTETEIPEGTTRRYYVVKEAE